MTFNVILNCIIIVLLVIYIVLIGKGKVRSQPKCCKDCKDFKGCIIWDTIVEQMVLNIIDKVKGKM